MNKEAIKLIDRLYKDLYLDDEVLHHSSGNKYDKFNNINQYLEKLESIHNRVTETGRHKDILKWMYYKKYVIKEEDIPESYYRHQQEVALQRGYGHIEITASQRKELQKEIIENQKKSLDTWLDYFLSEDAKVYPFWAKYWAFQGMLRLGNYNKETGEFGKRTKDTVAPFCDLNREALAMSIDMIIKLVDKEKIEDKDLEILVKSGSFKKIYTYILKNVLSDNKNTTKRNIGKWVKYEQGSNHMPLVESLKGYNTGWCTAGESTAENQLSMGDFYVYYTLDENNEYKVPRIAIRMEYGKIGEIRGVAKDQNIEPEMEEVVEEKIKDFPDKEEYYKKVNDMKLLTKVHKKHQNKEELTKEELSFLYEIEEDIIGFGYDEDPRIEEILNERNIKNDLSLVFDCSENQISTYPAEASEEKICHFGNLDGRYYNIFGQKRFPRYVKGDLDFYDLGQLALTIELPEIIYGNLTFSEMLDSPGLLLPQIVLGNLNMPMLVNSKNIAFPEKVGGTVYMNNLITCENLVLPEYIGGTLHMNGLRESQGIVLPKFIGEGAFLNGLTSTDGLIIPEPLTYTIYMNGYTITPENVHKYRNNNIETKETKSVK